MNKNTSSGLSQLFTVLCILGLNSCTVQATPDNAVIEQAEQHIRLQWQKNPKLSYPRCPTKPPCRNTWKAGEAGDSMYEESELYKEHGFPFMSCRLKLSCSGEK